MSTIYDANSSFDFSKLLFLKPTLAAGGNYFIRSVIDNKPIYIQLPKCTTKQGIVKSGKRHFCDLMFSNDEIEFIQWVENLETACKDIIFKNKDTWFDGDMDAQDIENYFTPSLKIYKSGKYYIARANISTTIGKVGIKVYDENGAEVDMETIVENTNMMTVVEVQGIRCSARSFQIDLELKQVMVIKATDLFETCVFTSIRKTSPTQLENNNSNSNIVSAEETPAEESHPLEAEVEAEMETKAEMEEVTAPLDLPAPPKDGLDEIELHLENIEETVVLKKRDEVYYDLYMKAKKKAKEDRDVALASYLEAKRIKNMYLLDDLSSDSEDEEDGVVQEE